ncbi:hypothetical protein ACQ4PT_025232 [Festuca glaucescens]
MDGNGGQEGFNPGRGGFNASRGGFGNGRGGFGPGRGGGNNHGGYAARGGRGFGAAPTQGVGRAGRGYGVGRGNYGNNGYGGGRHYAQGESSGTAGMGSGHHNDNWGGMNANFQRGPNFNNNDRFGNQQRWNSGHGGGFQYHPRVTDTGVPSRTGIDADLLQQTVQAVVAAVTVATKAVELSAAPASHATVVDGDRGQQVGMPVAAPLTSQLPTVISQGPQDNQGVEAKGKENEGQGAQKKKKEDKAGCFRCKKPGHYIDDCPTPFCDLCESIHHATSACHLLNAPKPTAILHGVKLPSKQEVQRLKNFGTYLCTDREAVLSFDLWSSVEEPLYTLPEVWVRVSGLPSDIRTDYLSLWGVGTLFGKTLDVYMAYTRNNRVLRTKIGCLDRNLIPAHSDVFIRRGFFKLHFEVETTQGSQEVNMAEANNGNDGNDDANNGEESHGGGNAMDMDPKGVDEGNTSNNNGKEGTNENNGVEGMQVQSNNVDAIQIGTMKLPITPTDYMARASTSGLPQVAGVAAVAGLPLADNQLSAQRSAIGAQTAQQPAAADLPRADSAQRARQAEALPANGVQGTGVSVGSHAPVGDQRRSGPAPEMGSAVAVEKRPGPLSLVEKGALVPVRNCH